MPGEWKVTRQPVDLAKVPEKHVLSLSQGFSLNVSRDFYSREHVSWYVYKGADAPSVDAAITEALTTLPAQLRSVADEIDRVAGREPQPDPAEQIARWHDAQAERCEHARDLMPDGMGWEALTQRASTHRDSAFRIRNGEAKP